MTDLADLIKIDNQQPARSIHIVDPDGFDAWLASQPAPVRAVAAAQKFKGKPHEVAIIPTEGEEWAVAAGVADRQALGPWCLARAAEMLPEGTYRLMEGATGAAALGWLTAQYRFDRYRAEEKPAGPRVLLTGDVARIEQTVQMLIQ